MAIDANQNITIRQGTTADFEMQYLNSANEPIDITGVKFRFTLSRRAGGIALLSIITGDDVVDPAGSNPYDPANEPTSSWCKPTDAVNGRWQLMLSAVATKNLPFGDWVYEIDMIASDGRVRTILSGDFVVQQELG